MRHKSTITRRSETGFTLVEVMVVVLIIGILLAVGIPTFLGARNRADDTAARANLDAVFDTATIVSDFGTDYSKADQAALTEAEPAFTYLISAQASTGPEEISVDASAPGRWTATVMSHSGTCFATTVNPTGRTTYESSICSAAAANTSTLTGTAATDAIVSDGFELDGDGFITVPNGSGSHGSATTGPSATFTFSVLEPGQFTMLGTTIAPNGNDDSFWVRTSLDGFATAYLWDVPQSRTPRQTYVSNRGISGYGGPAIVLDLPVSPSFTVIVSAREDGTSIRDLTFERQ